MQGPNFKVGKTDIVNDKGNRIVTETKNEKTKDGKSIWTIKQEVDFNNDGVVDQVTFTKETYDKKGNKISTTELKDKDGDGKVDEEVVTNYSYDKKGRVINSKELKDKDGDGKVDEEVVTNTEYNDKAKKYKRTKEIDRNNDGAVDERYINEGNYNAKKPSREYFEFVNDGLKTDTNYEEGITEVESEALGHETHIHKIKE